MIHVIIMAGGKGTRFWPLSRSKRAKQFLNILGHKSLIEQTIQRILPSCTLHNLWIVTNQTQKTYINKIKYPLKSKQILYEPMGKNTAACIGWAATEILKKDPQATLVILPADHIIKQTKQFNQTIKKATKLAQKENCLVTIGIKPDKPHTGYGYIETTNAQKCIDQVLAFHEKPDLLTAQKFLKTGRFFWNSGMFIWQAQTIIDLMAHHLPQHYQILQKIASLPKDSQYSQKLSALFSKFPNISIDYGILEKAHTQTKMIQSNFTWNDLGSWSALEEYLKKDPSNNAVKGKLKTLNSQNNLVFSPHKLVTLIDVQNLIVVDTPDALLVLPKSSDQKIKDLLNTLPLKYQ
jgi:mannose-1-phosphate guanylyltransferase